MGKATFCP
ncbi:hypothetical protein YPPY32_1764, partial [Yersinia pestis PY-32]